MSAGVLLQENTGQALGGKPQAQGTDDGCQLFHGTGADAVGHGGEQEGGDGEDHSTDHCQHQGVQG